MMWKVSALFYAALVGMMIISLPARADTTSDLNACNNQTGEAAIAACTALINSEKLKGRDLADAYFNRSLAYHEIGEGGKAEEDGDRGLNLTPSDASFQNYADLFADESTAKHKYWCQVQYLGNFRAVGECTYLIDSGKFTGRTLAELFRSRADHEDHIGSFQRAIDDADKANDLDPDDKWTLEFRIGPHCGLGQYRAAITDTDFLLERFGPSAYTFQARGEAKQKAGDKTGAEADLKKALSLGWKKGHITNCEFYDFVNQWPKNSPSSKSK